MIRAVADTHTLIWYLFGDSRLSTSAREFIDTTASEGHQVGVSAISRDGAIRLSSVETIW